MVNAMLQIPTVSLPQPLCLNLYSRPSDYLGLFSSFMSSKCVEQCQQIMWFINMLFTEESNIRVGRQALCGYQFPHFYKYVIIHLCHFCKTLCIGIFHVGYILFIKFVHRKVELWSWLPCNRKNEGT